MPRQYSRISSDDFKDNDSQQIAYLRSPSTASVISTTSVASTDPSVQSIGQRISDKIHASKSGMPHTQIIQIYNHSHLVHYSSLSIIHYPSSILVVVWISIALFTVDHTDTIHVILSSEEPIRPLLHIAITQITINTILLLYLGVYLPKIKGLKDTEAWSVYCPRVIPFMTLNGLICIFTLIRSLWPVWGFLTPFILGVESLGLLFSTHFVPWI
jgi:hypothetical protein